MENIKDSSVYTMQEKKHDTYTDKIFIKHLVKRVQDLDDDVSAYIYPDVNIVVFLRNGVVFHKVVLDKFNMSDVNLDWHVKRAETSLRLLRSGLIGAATMSQARNESKKLSTKYRRSL